MVKIDIVPLSVNKAWQGRRYKTVEYKRFERDCLLMLPKLCVSKERIKIVIEYGFSNKLSDIDNPTKLILDILQKKYGFNDNQIYILITNKKIVTKGKEYFAFKIENI